MIRLNSWQEAVNPDSKERLRLSDIIPSHHNPDHTDGSRDKTTRKSSVVMTGATDTDLSSIFGGLQKRERIEEIQFWTDFQVFQRQGAVERCLFVRATSKGEHLTADERKIDVVDEFEVPAILYLSLRWMRRQQMHQDRPVSAALRGRSIDQEIMEGDIFCLYDFVKAGSIIIADKFHF